MTNHKEHTPSADCSPVTEASNSASKQQGAIAQSGIAKSTHTATPCSSDDGPECQTTATSARSIGLPSNGQTSLWGDSLAKTCHSQDGERDSLKVPARGYGTPSLTAFAHFVPGSFLPRTWQASLFPSPTGTIPLQSFSQSWPRSGMMRNGVLSAPQAWERGTGGTGCSLSRGDGTIPTPNHWDWNVPETQEAWEKRAAVWAEKGVRLHLPLKSFVQRNDIKFRTPSTSDVEGGVMEIREGANARYKLRDQAHAMLPTPQSTDYVIKKTSKSWKQQGRTNFTLSNPELLHLLPTPRHADAACPRLTQTHEGKNFAILTDAVRTMLPTPRAANPGSRPNGKGGKILNEEAQILMGVRTRGEYQFPTPRLRDSYSRDSKKMIIERNEENRDLDLTAKVKYDAMMLPTPRASEATHPRLGGTQEAVAHLSLTDAVKDKAMFPTPSTQDTITHPDAVLTQDGRRASKDGTTSHSLSLADSFPTPKARDHRGTSIKHDALPDAIGENRVKDSRRLNPEWVSLLMGVPAWWLDLRADGNAALAAPELLEIRQGWIDGTWDAGHSPLREITDKKEWKERIMALGNGVVPQCAMVVANEMMTWRLDNGTA